MRQSSQFQTFLFFYEKILHVQNAQKAQKTQKAQKSTQHKQTIFAQKFAAFVAFCTLVFVLLVCFCL